LRFNDVFSSIHQFLYREEGEKVVCVWKKRELGVGVEEV
jgi:hypothetical protein